MFIRKKITWSVEIVTVIVTWAALGPLGDRYCHSFSSSSYSNPHHSSPNDHHSPILIERAFQFISTTVGHFFFFWSKGSLSILSGWRYASRYCSYCSRCGILASFGSTYCVPLGLKFAQHIAFPIILFKKVGPFFYAPLNKTYLKSWSLLHHRANWRSPNFSVELVAGQALSVCKAIWNFQWSPHTTSTLFQI